MRETLRNAQHLVRLLLLFAAGIILFFVARALLVPPGFGELGHFRTGAIEDSRKRTPLYAGRTACAECHDSAVSDLAAGTHKNLSCEACHGALAAHAVDPDKSAPVKLDAKILCARCHSANPARPAKHPQVDFADHFAEDSCLDCHKAHSPAVE